jgi:hypothetical protein
MRDPAYLLFGLAMLLGAACSSLLYPRYRNHLATLRDAGRIRPLEAEKKLRFFVLLVGLWFALGAIAVWQYLRPGP